MKDLHTPYYYYFSDRLLEGKEEYKEILKIIPGTLEFDNQIQLEVNRHNQLKIILCQVFDETADSNVSHVSGSSEMDHIREMESQVS